MKFSKYMDSFPFPYYIVLRNIEALPRTLANLLRQVSLSSFFLYPTEAEKKKWKINIIIKIMLFQWLELMQHSNY
jgi:hypothetical protein